MIETKWGSNCALIALSAIKSFKNTKHSLRSYSSERVSSSINARMLLLVCFFICFHSYWRLPGHSPRQPKARWSIFILFATSRLSRWFIHWLKKARIPIIFLALAGSFEVELRVKTCFFRKRESKVR